MVSFKRNQVKRNENIVEKILFCYLKVYSWTSTT